MAEINIKLHKAQREIFNNSSRYKTVCSGRRFGKTYLDISVAIRQAFSYTYPIDPLSPPVVLCVTPLLKQGRQLFFNPLVNLLDGKPGINVNKSDFRIEIKGKPDIVVRGFNDSAGDSLRGFKIAALIADEVQDFRSIEDIDATILPAMADTLGSQAIFSGTPKGKARNVLYQLYLRTLEREGWSFYQKVTADNPFIPRSEIENAESTLSERLFAQEFLATFTEFPGKFFTEANKNRHLVNLPRASTDEVFYISIDPGVVNPGLTLFSVGTDRVFRVYKTFYEKNADSYTTDELIDIAENIASERTIKRIFIPDDRKDLVKSFRVAGWKQAILVKRSHPNPIQRANILNSLFKTNRLLIDSSEGEFWDEIASYHRETGPDGEIKDSIADGQQDHRIDALAYGIAKLCLDYPFLLPHSVLLPNNFINDDYDDTP